MLSNKWGPVVVVVLLDGGSLRFSELEGRIPGISPNMLTKTLESLSTDGLVTRSVISESPLTVTYELTEAGYELQPVFDSLTTWADEHVDSVRPTTVLGDRDHRLVELYRSWLSDQFDVVTVTGPEQLQHNLADAPDVAIFDISLWNNAPTTLIAHSHTTTRRIALVGDRPEPSLCTWPCDDVLRKPLVKSELLTAVTQQLDQFDQPEAERERDGIEARLALLESIYSRPVLEQDATVSRLYDRLESLDKRA
ncbi:winged helix-turn-helix transcriptional regulator [Natrarchaeobaculum sulfurireducens]|uniref:DNA-binding transcriptional regulator, HxlR family n=1 Tax=Natrarchaeobaculum sulfurireducens TaxID=2044521 RepID=A0A346P9L1_9EURY|nr:helix-turn-helix domain-containing protein [Natrarchaeobaculum sulfurireducens]AXR76206.1 HoxA-like transcriptional regulator [Natrarchaeobaculum sulfurireducens]AXR79887.1 DNA-binding transcriptional regulator, HxlR family [Natrarchaeobaculum sulfurireducens]